MKITGATTLGELKAAPEFREFAEYLNVDTTTPREKLDAQTMGDWGPEVQEAVIGGLDRLQEIERQGVCVSYDIYSEEELKADPGKRMTNLIYFPGEPGRPYVIVCAGGAYVSVASFLEGYPVAAELNELGYTAFVLSYRVGQGEGPLLPKPQEDLAQAVRFIMAHADEFHVPADEYAVMGFSAGGHLAASWGSENLGYAAHDLPKPGALLLAYPALSTAVFDPQEEVGHGYLTTMVGPKLEPEALNAADVTKHMGRTYPATYLIHSKDDPLVPVRTSTLCFERCRELGVPCKLQLVDGCGHGFGTGVGEAKGWIAKAATFFEEHRRQRWFSCEHVNDHITRIFGAADERMYLVEGTERAALIDTGVGVGDLAGYVSTLTEKPLTVLLTHAHVDHAMGAWEFAGTAPVHLNGRDLPLYRRDSSPSRAESMAAMWPWTVPHLNEVGPVELLPLEDGQTFDLGGVTIEALACPGHTVGSMVFLLREDRLLLLGDACNPNTLLCDEYSTTVEEYRDALVALGKKVEGRYDGTLFSHGYGVLPGPEAIPQMIELCRTVMDREDEKVPSDFLGTPCLMAKRMGGQGAPADGSGVNIAYLEDRIFAPAGGTGAGGR